MAEELFLQYKILSNFIGKQNRIQHDRTFSKVKENGKKWKLQLYMN